MGYISSTPWWPSCLPWHWHYRFKCTWWTMWSWRWSSCISSSAPWQPSLLPWRWPCDLVISGVPGGLCDHGAHRHVFLLLPHGGHLCYHDVDHVTLSFQVYLVDYVIMALIVMYFFFCPMAAIFVTMTLTMWPCHFRCTWWTMWSWRSSSCISSSAPWRPSLLPWRWSCDLVISGVPGGLRDHGAHRHVFLLLPHGGHLCYHDVDHVTLSFQVYLVDYVIMALIVMYFFFCSMAAIKQLGIWCFCLRVSSIDF